MESAVSHAMDDPSPPPLHYASAPRPRWRPSPRAAVAVALVLTVAVAGILRGPQLLRRALILYWQDRCLNGQAPPGQIIGEWTRGASGGALLSAAYNPLSRDWSQLMSILSPPGPGASATLF